MLLYSVASPPLTLPTYPFSRYVMCIASCVVRRHREATLSTRLPMPAVHQRRLNTVDETVRSVTVMLTRWRSSRAVVTLRGPVPACSSLSTTLFYPLVPYTHNRRSSKPCTSRNVTVWQTCFPETNHSAPFECTHLLILRPFASRHTCTSFHVSTLFGSSALTEQGITLTLLVTQEMSLLGLCIRHLSGNVITYWWYTGLYISQVWSCSDHSVRMFV